MRKELRNNGTSFDIYFDKQPKKCHFSHTENYRLVLRASVFTKFCSIPENTFSPELMFHTNNLEAR